MNNLSITFLTTLFFLGSLTSCYKDYVCECEGGLGIKTHELEKRTRQEAEDECNRSSINNTDPVTGKGSCRLREK